MQRWKNVLIVMLVSLSIVIVLAGSAESVYASGFLTEDTIIAFFSKYPIGNYMMDVYVDTASNWMPWNWGKALDDGIFSILLWLLNVLYLAYNWIMYALGYIVQQLYTFDLVVQLIDKIGEYVQNIFGFNGQIIPGGLFPSLILLIITCVGAWLIWLGFLKRETGKAMNGVISFFCILLMSLAFIANISTIIKGANQFSVELQGIVITPITSVFEDGQDTDVSVRIREQLFNLTIYKPYLLLQYNSTNISNSKADEILRYKWGSEEREEAVMEEAENGNIMMDGWSELPFRIVMLLLLAIVNLILCFIVMVFAGLIIYHQIVFLIFIVASPFVLIISMVPSMSHVGKKWIGKTVYELYMKVMISMLLTFMFALSNMVFDLTDTRGYLIAAIIQVIIYIAVYSFRNELFALFTGGNAQKGGGLRKVIAGAYMYKRAMGAIKGAGSAGNKQRESSGNSRDNQEEPEQPETQSKNKDLKEHLSKDKKGLANRKAKEKSNVMPSSDLAKKRAEKQSKERSERGRPDKEKHVNNVKRTDDNNSQKPNKNSAEQKVGTSKTDVSEVKGKDKKLANRDNAKNKGISPRNSTNEQTQQEGGRIEEHIKRQDVGKPDLAKRKTSSRDNAVNGKKDLGKRERQADIASKKVNENYDGNLKELKYRRRDINEPKKDKKE